MRARLDPIDHAWLRMERPDNPMMITGVLTFDEPLDLDRLCRTLATRIGRFARFTQRVRPGRLGRRAVWEDDPSFAIERHVEHRLLPPPADRAVLQREIGRLVSTRLRRDRPLWAIHVLESPTDGRTVLVARLHHCIADGFALLYVLLGLTDEGPEPPLELAGGAVSPSPRAGDPHGAPLPTPSPTVLRTSGLDPIAGRWGPVDQRHRFAMPGLRLRRGRRFRDSLEPMRASSESAVRHDPLAIGAALARLATLKDQPPSVLRGPLGQQKRAAWSRAIALDDVKAIARRLGGTVNDALMSATTAALARYLRERGEDPSGFELRAAVPVNLRSSARMQELGNYFGLVFLELPLGIDDPRARFDELKRRMDRLKRSPEAGVLLKIMQIVGAGPRWLEDVVVRVLGAKTTAVLTNVPGPREPRYLAGRRIRTVMFWVPQTGRVSLGISIFSYAGEVRLGLAADALSLPDPERVLEAFPEELEALREA